MDITLDHFIDMAHGLLDVRSVEPLRARQKVLRDFTEDPQARFEWWVELWESSVPNGGGNNRRHCPCEEVGFSRTAWCLWYTGPLKPNIQLFLDFEIPLESGQELATVG